MDLFKLIVLIALVVVLVILLLSPGQTIPAAPRVSAPATALVVAQATPTQPMPTATQPVAPRLTSPATALAVAQATPTQPMPTATQPVAPRLTSPAADAILSDGKVTVTGTGQPGSKIQVLVDGKVVGEAEVGADGTWAFATDLGKPGSHTLSTQVVDASGKPVSTSESVSMTLVAPTPKVEAPTLTSPSAGDQVTTGPVTFSGTGAPGLKVQVVMDGKVIGQAQMGSDGSWSLRAELSQPGTHQVLVRAVDASGQVVAQSALLPLSVAAATIKPVITSPAAGASLPSGPMALAGTGKPDDELEIVDSGKVVGTVKIGADGQWRFTYKPASGERELLARAKGNPEVASDVLKVTVAAAAVLPLAGGDCVGPKGRIENDTYIVGVCDTLSRISQISQVSLEALLAANPQITDPDLIRIGQVIQLPR